MKTDLYTKVVLTTIALCLIWICAQRTPATVSAQSYGALQRVVLVDGQGRPIYGESMGRPALIVQAVR
jgi:hypothetical protein